MASSFYSVLAGGRRLDESLKVLPPNAERETRFVLRTIDETLHGYIRGMLVVSLIYGVGTASVMLATGLPAALPVAIVSSVLLAVPFIGDWLALALPLIVAACARSGGSASIHIRSGSSAAPTTTWRPPEP